MSLQAMVNDPQMGFRGPTRVENDALVATVALHDERVSQGRDPTHKPRVYAAGSSELWGVDLPAREVVVHRDPRTAPVTGYASIERLPFDAELTGVTV